MRVAPCEFKPCGGPSPESGVAFILPRLRDGGKNDRGAGVAGQLCNPAERGIEEKAGEQDEAGVATGFEDGEAIVGSGNVEPDDLPGKMRRESGKRERKNRPGASRKACGTKQDDGEPVE